MKPKPFAMGVRIEGLQEDIKAKMDENIIFRKNRQPNLSIPNAGSVFKNPENCEFSAGALIDKCNLRGFQIGDVQIWENHCNFVINKGKATSDDYINVIFEMYSRAVSKRALRGSVGVSPFTPVPRTITTSSL